MASAAAKVRLDVAHLGAHGRTEKERVGRLIHVLVQYTPDRPFRAEVGGPASW
jgi:hypothetical protein